MIPTLTLFAVILATLLGAALAGVIFDLRERHRHVRVKLNDRRGFYS